MNKYLKIVLLGIIAVIVIGLAFYKIRHHSYAKMVYAICLAIFLFVVWFVRHTLQIRYTYDKLFYEGFTSWFRSLGAQHPLAKKIIPNRIEYHTYRKKIIVDEIPQHRSRKNWSILIDFNGRATPEDVSRYLFTITPQTAFPKTTFVPRWSLFLSTMLFLDPKSLLTHTSYSKPTKFCAVLENPNPDAFQRDCLEMVRYYETVDVLQPDVQDIFMYQPYRFILVFDDPKWVSEQLLLPLLAGCIPVYFGATDVNEYFNPKRFLHIRSYASFQQCVARMLALHKQPVEAEKIVKEPLMNDAQFKQYVGWYQRDSSFFKQMYTAIPELQTRIYTPFLNRAQHDPNRCVKVINLDRSKDRWESMLQQLETHPLKDLFERFPAVDGKSFEAQRPDHIACKRQILGGKRSSTFKAGEIGVYFSNMDLFYTLTQDPQNDYYVVLEDDIQIARLEHPQVYIDEAPPDWDVLFIGYNKLLCKPTMPESAKYFRLGYECMPGNFAFIVRKRAAQYYLNFGVPMEVPIDEFQRYQSANLNIYIREPSVVEVEYTNDSTISDSLR
jgi:GR25 family glycosyltransferase involved in LPS biosynthesis